MYSKRACIYLLCHKLLLWRCAVDYCVIALCNWQLSLMQSFYRFVAFIIDLYSFLYQVFPAFRCCLHAICIWLCCLCASECTLTCEVVWRLVWLTRRACSIMYLYVIQYSWCCLCPEIAVKHSVACYVYYFFQIWLSVIICFEVKCVCVCVCVCAVSYTHLTLPTIYSV